MPVCIDLHGSLQRIDLKPLLIACTLQQLFRIVAERLRCRRKAIGHASIRIFL